MCEAKHIQIMRKYGGGLIFLMLSPKIKNKLSLPYLHDIYTKIDKKYPILENVIPNDIPYDIKSSFSISLNHRKTFTGITDNDRALTISELGKLAKVINNKTKEEAQKIIGENFRSPGHVPLCLADDQILKKRFGHTELGCALSLMAGLSGIMVGCEIMGDNGNSMPKHEVQAYANKNDIPFLEGEQIIKAWENKINF